MNIYYVYAYLRQHASVNGEAGSPYYIGRGRGNRIRADHSKCGGKNPLDNRFALKIFENCTSEEASNLERGLIKIFGRIDIKTGCLHNKTNGGEGTTGLFVSSETRKKQSDAKLGKVPWNKGLKTPLEVRKKQSDVKKGKHISPATEFKKGERHSIETEFKKGVVPKTAFKKGHIPWHKKKN